METKDSFTTRIKRILPALVVVHIILSTAVIVFLLFFNQPQALSKEEVEKMIAEAVKESEVKEHEAIGASHVETVVELKEHVAVSILTERDYVFGVLCKAVPNLKNHLLCEGKEKQ